MERQDRPDHSRRSRPRRLAGLLVCVAVPALLATACSSGSGGGSGNSADKSGSGSAPKAGGSAPAVAPAQYKKLPAACSTVTKATVSAIVPKAKESGGTQSKSTDVSTRGGCSWTGNGKDGYQYRWLSVTLQRYDSSAQLGSAQDQAKQRYTDEVDTLGKGRHFGSKPVPGLGDDATLLTGRWTDAKITSQNATVVTRAGNIVVIVDYQGAGLEGKKNPSASTVQGDAQRAAKDVVASVTGANASLGG